MEGPTIAIGITTKDRWDDLSVTLDSLRQNGLHRLETIVIDDGSTTPMPYTFRDRFDWVKFERSESSQGYIVQRNRLAQLLTAEVYLSLDDDSYPVPQCPARSRRSLVNVEARRSRSSLLQFARLSTR